jgi:signal transduction histidine kinase
VSTPPPRSAPAWWTAAVRIVGGLIVTGTAAGTVWTGFVHDDPPLHVMVAGVLGLAALAVLALRYRRPAAVLVVTLGLAGATDVLVGRSSLASSGRVAVVIALYMVGTRFDGRRGLVAAAVSWLLLSVTELLGHRGSGVVVGDLVLIVAVTAIFLYVRSYRALIESYRERAEQAEREQGWQTNRAVGAERVRIARELHDVVAHHVSLLVVQAGAVRETLPVDHPTRPVLDSMIDGGRHAMSELRDMLDALRLVGPVGIATAPVSGAVPDPSPQAGAGPAAVDVAPRSPQPDVDQVAGLIGGAGAAGMDVVLVVEGDRVDLPPTVSLAAYRIVQESLTNVVKHAAASTVRVRLAYRARSFEVEVVNTPRSIAGLPRYPDAAAGDVRGGHGITGMRERVILAGGDLTAGPCPEGWKVHGRFPLGSVPGGTGRVPVAGATW